MRNVLDERFERFAEDVKLTAQDATTRLSHVLNLARASANPANAAAQCIGPLQQLRDDLARIEAEFATLAESGDDADVQM